MRRTAGAAGLALLSLSAGCAPSNEPPAGDGSASDPREHLVLLLEPDCRLDAGTGELVLPDGSRFSPPLGAAFDLRPMIPDLADADRSRLSEDEIRLASYVLLVPAPDRAPAGGLARTLESAAAWPCVREGRRAPSAALP